MSFYARQLAGRMLKRSTTWTRTDARVWVQEELGHAPADQLLVAVCRSLGCALVTPELEDEVTIMEWVENEVEGMAVDAIDWTAVWEKAHNEGVTTCTLSSFIGNYGRVYERRVEAREKAAAREKRRQEGEEVVDGFRVTEGDTEDDEDVLVEPTDEDRRAVNVRVVRDGERVVVEPKGRLPDQDDAEPYATGFPSMRVQVDGRSFTVHQGSGDQLQVFLSGTFTADEAEDLYDRWIAGRIKFPPAVS